jgi:hypothetical protein
VSHAPPGATWATAAAQMGGDERPADADATRESHLRSLLRGRGLAYFVVLGSVAALIVGAYLHSVLVIAAGPLLVTAIALAAAFVLADRRAEQDFFAAFAAQHGFDYVGDTELLPLTPLLGAGEKRRCDHYMEGQLDADGLRCGLGHFTYVLREKASKGGHETRHFTICVADLEAGLSLFPGIFLTRRRGLLGFLDGKEWLSHANRRKVELESAELCERYDLYVDNAQDEVQLRELFAPSFIVWLAGHPLAPCFEYRAGTLVVYVERSLDDTTHLDWLLEAATEIAGRLAREVQEQERVA